MIVQSSRLCKKVFLLVLLFSLFLSCSKKDDDPVNPDSGTSITPEKTEVKTYELILLRTNKSLSGNYTGKFGSEPVEIIKTSDTTLSFMVPEVANGQHTLEFELASISFNVTQTEEVNPDEVVSIIFQKFDEEVAAIVATTPEETAEKDSLQLFKQEVLSIFNALTPEEKRKNVLYYEANKELYTSFKNSVKENLNGSAGFKLSSLADCPKTDKKSKFSCIARHLGDLCNKLAASLIKANYYSKNGEYPLIAGAYLLSTNVRPTLMEFRGSITAFFNAKFILDESIFDDVAFKFPDQNFADLKLKSQLRTFGNNDGLLGEGFSYFATEYSSVWENWNSWQFKFLGKIPYYTVGVEDIELSTYDITISDISDPNVQLTGQQNEQVKFKTLSGEEKSFTFTINVKKEGFELEKKLIGVITGGYYIEVISGDGQQGQYDKPTPQPVVFKLSSTDPDVNVSNQRIFISYSTEEDGLFDLVEVYTQADGTFQVSNWILKGKGRGSYSYSYASDDDQIHTLKATYSHYAGSVSTQVNATAHCRADASWGPSSQIQVTDFNITPCGTCTGLDIDMKLTAQPTGGVGNYKLQYGLSCNPIGYSGVINNGSSFTSDCTRICVTGDCETRPTAWVEVVDQRGCWNNINY